MYMCAFVLWHTNRHVCVIAGSVCACVCVLWFPVLVIDS